jgi:Uma2 family endonuclease
MATVTSPVPEGRVRFSREAYHRLAEAGILDYDARVELIDGDIIMMLRLGPPQGSSTSRLTDLFVKQLTDSYQCRVQLPIAANDYSEPQPDIAIVRRQENDYRDEHPLPSNVVLLIEVSSSSLKFDLGAKLELYARSNIAEYWVVKVERQEVLVHRNPQSNRYENISTFAVGATIAPVLLPDCHVNLGWLFR